MGKKVVYVYNPPYPPARNYGCFNFLMDAFLIVITCGLWIIVIIVRDSRR